MQTLILASWISRLADAERPFFDRRVAIERNRSSFCSIEGTAPASSEMQKTRALDALNEVSKTAVCKREREERSTLTHRLQGWSAESQCRCIISSHQWLINPQYKNNHRDGKTKISNHVLQSLNEESIRLIRRFILVLFVQGRVHDRSVQDRFHLSRGKPPYLCLNSTRTHESLLQTKEDYLSIWQKPILVTKRDLISDKF